MSTKVLVTGANGQLAKTIKNLFFSNNDNIEFTFVTKSKLDISKKKKLTSYFDKSNFDYCINCAAYTNVNQAEITPKLAYKINAKAVKHLAECCKLNNITLIHISTDYVFDGTKNEPYLESDKTNPVNEYGKSKLLGENYIQEILENYFIIRTSWLYSAYGKNFVKSIINKINEGSELNITTSQKGTPTSCLDLAKFIYFLIKNEEKKFGIYHFSALGAATWHSFALYISNHFKDYRKESIQPVKSYKSDVNRPVYSVLNNRKSQAIFNQINHWKKSVDEVVNKLLKK